MTRLRSQGYGTNAPLVTLNPPPVVADRAPTSNDVQYELGRKWIYNDTEYTYFGAGSWSVTGGAIFDQNPTVTTLTATGTITANALTVTTDVGTATVTASGAITGASVTVTGKSKGQVVEATGDTTGTASATSMSNATNTTQGAGTLSVKSTNGNNGDNTGFLKFYVNGVAAYVPYFLTIAP